jgi:Tfp pilus assembly protein PilO
MQVLTRNPHAERVRYNYYYQRLWRYYQKPAIKVSLSLLLTIFAVTFFAAFAIRPTLNTIAELLRKIEDQKEVSAKLEKKMAALSSLQSEYTVIQENQNVLEAAMPPNEDYQNLFMQLEAVAAANALPIYSLNVTSAQDSSVQAMAQPRNEVPQYPSVNFSLVTQGTYEQLKPFLSDVTRLARLMKVESIQFNQPDEDEMEILEEPELTLVINFKAFYVDPVQAEPEEELEEESEE